MSDAAFTQFTFRPRWDWDYDQFGQPPDGTYSRLAWLPALGPTSWLLWTTIASQLAEANGDVVWSRDDLSAALGLKPRNRHGWTIARALMRLRNFRLVALTEGVFYVPMTAPPVTPGIFDRLPSDVQRLHLETFRVGRTSEE